MTLRVIRKNRDAVWGIPVFSDHVFFNFVLAEDNSAKPDFNQKKVTTAFCG